MSDQQQQSTSPQHQVDIMKVRLIIELHEQHIQLKEKMYQQELDKWEQKLKELETEKVKLRRMNSPLLQEFERMLENERAKFMETKKSLLLEYMNVLEKAINELITIQVAVKNETESFA